MTSSKSSKHSLMSPTKSKKPSTVAEAPRKSKRPSTMAPKLHQPPPPVVQEHHEEMTDREEEDSDSESQSGSESASSSSEERTAEKEQEEEEDEDDEDKNSDKSDSDSEESGDEIAFTVKPVVSKKSPEPKASAPVLGHTSTPVVNEASTPAVNHASRSKRSAESESVPNESKRKKLTDNGGRMWTEEDELAIFNGLIAYQKRKKGLFTYADTGDFHQFIKKNLHLQADDGKLSNKIKRLKSKYFSKGEDQVFTKPHDIEMFELSKKIWGVQDIVVDDSARPSNQKPKSRAVSQAAGARSNQKPKSKAVSEAAGNKPDVAEMRDEVKFAGGPKKEPDDFWLKYPSINVYLSSQRSCDLSSQLRQKIQMLGSNNSTKLEELEKEWSDIQLAELMLSYRKDDGRMKLTKFVLDLMDSGSKD